MLPVYNGMPLLKASIESIRRQTYPNWQCIICDDGSTDDTWVFLQTLKDDGRFMLLQNDTNRGRGYTRQRILEACQGKYICMLDAGDMMHPDRLRFQVEYLESHPVIGLVSSGMLSFGTKTEQLLVRGNAGTHTFCANRSNYPCYAPSMMRKSIAEQCHYSSHLDRGEDTEYLNQFFSINPQYAVLPQLLYFYDELEDISKWRLTVSYLDNVLIALRYRQHRYAILNALKFIYAIVVYPFTPTQKIIARRGRSATAEERALFIKNK